MGKIREMLEGWILKIALKKGAKAALGVIVSAKILQEAGVTVDAAKFETWLMAAGAALVTMSLNWLKVKTSVGRKFL